MLEQLRSCYPTALKFIEQNFQCENLPVFVECRRPSAYDIPNPQAREYAVYVRTERYANVEKHIYNSHFLTPDVVILQNNFRHYLTRDFANKMAELFYVDDQKDFAKIHTYFKHFIHDGDLIPTTIQDIIIDDNRSVTSEVICSQYKKESQLYAHPTQVFTKIYENWNINLGNVVSLRTLPEASKKDINLGDALKAQYLTPLLRCLIKLWIIHQIICHFKEEELQQSEFFKGYDVEQYLSQLQDQITNKIKDILALSPEERKKIAKIESNENKFSLSPLTFNLLQRIPFIKLIVGSSRHDVHKLTHPSLPFFSRAVFYLKTYLNLSLSKYLVLRSAKDLKKAIKLNHNFISGEASLWSLTKGFFRLLKSLYLTVWMPFIATYFLITGLTSLPFNLIRRIFQISFGKGVDKALSYIEAAKDLILLCFAAPIAYNVFTSIGITLLGPLGLSFGTTFVFTVSFLVTLPFLLLGLLDTFETYPAWITDQYGYTYYKTENDYDSAVNGLKALASNPLISIHGFIAGVALLSYSTIAITGRLINKAMTLFKSNQLGAAELRTQVGNLNHTEKFKMQLHTLAQKLENHSCITSDNQLLDALSHCQLTPFQKTELRKYLQAKIADASTPEKNTFRLALHHLDKKEYLPSWKLISRLEEELSSQNVNEELKKGVHQVHEIYTTQLGACI